MKQDIESQYDDDLTIGTDEYDDSYYTDADDLFDFSTNDESPISRLKSLVLSIDWEITDEVLLQFNEELIDLKGIWAGNSINLVYVQALEKLSKYIYQNKANSHPNAIKLLLTLYYNLEKVVSSDELSETQKKEILLEDVKRFEVLKRQISKTPGSVQSQVPTRPPSPKVRQEPAPGEILLHLKAIVLGIDWEITDQELNNLRREVLHLEELFAGSRPRLILLQGIGTLGAYIKTKKSNAHADAFKVLHLFYESLEKMVKTPMTLEEEKAILFPAVEKFNEFKILVGQTISPEAIGRDQEEEEDEEDYDEGASGVLAPALSDVIDEERGFQADEEARALGIESTEGVASHIDTFFGERPQAAGSVVTKTADSDSSLEEVIAPAGLAGDAEVTSVEKDIALQGVDVGQDEEEDDEEYEPEVAALADVDDEFPEGEEAADDHVAVGAPPSGAPASSLSEEEIAQAADMLFADTEIQPGETIASVDREIALQGVNVETEADEDSDEASLPMEGEEIAPALITSEEESLFSAQTLESGTAGDIGEEIAGTLEGLFVEEQLPAIAGLEPTEGEDSSSIVSDELLPEQGREELETPATEEMVEAAVDELEAALAEPEIHAADLAQDEITAQEEETVDRFFAGSEAEDTEDLAAVDSLFESLEPISIEEPEEVSEPAEAVDQLEVSRAQDEQVEEVEFLDKAEAGDLLEEERLEISEVEPPVEDNEELFQEDEFLPEAEEVALAGESEQESLLEEEIPAGEDELSPVSISAAEEVLSFENGDVPAEEMLSFEDVDALAEEEISPAEEMAAEDEETAPAAAESLLALEEEPGISAAEEVLSFENGDVPAEEVLTFEDVDALAEEEISPAEQMAAEDEETAPAAAESLPALEEEPVFEEESTEELLSFADDALPADEISPPVEAFSLDEDGISAETGDFAATAAPPEDFIQPATTSPVEAWKEEGEVVFELAEEVAEEAISEPDFLQPEEPAFAFADQIFDELPSTLPATVENEEALAVAVALAAAPASTSDDPLIGLYACIESLGIELNDRIIEGLYRAINDLRQTWWDKPLEKTFLQLLSTITQHIDRYRYEASAEAHNLLLSVYGALAARREDDQHHNQELLLRETLKVLEWQQGMLTRQTVQKGSQLTFVAPVRTEEASGQLDAQEDFDHLLQHEETDERQAGAESPVVATEPAVGLARESLAIELKQELDALRMTLQKEIAELRSELTRR